MTPYENIQKIVAARKPSMRWDGVEPLDAWQERARAKLVELMGLHNMISCEPNLKIEWERDESDHREIRFLFESEPDYFVPCHLWIPKGATLPLPTVICLQGHSKGMHISMGRCKFEGEAIRGDRDFCVRAVKEGFAAIALEQRNFGECGGAESDGKPQCLHPSLTNLLVGRTTIGERVWDVMRLVDLLLSDATFTSIVKPDEIYTLGNSGGGTACTYCGAVETRLAGTIPSSAIAAFAPSIGARRHCACNYISHIMEYFDMSELLSLTAPRKLVVVNGPEDTGFPIKGAIEMVEIAKKAYEAAGVPDRIYHVIGDEGHRFYADLAWPVLKNMK